MNNIENFKIQKKKNSELSSTIKIIWGDYYDIRKSSKIKD
jgi:hypothetical protein